ncbi:MAG: hypothetical protein LBD07_05875 [Spirochaetaceae bacterium]|jgi:hypothetical protein|nr:hypothetical protein [Spirochaetaceae bacterium]
MAYSKDYIPTRDADFGGWLTNLTGYAFKKVNDKVWEHIPVDKITQLKSHETAWLAAFAKIAGPHTSVDTEEKNDARKAAEAFVRPFVQQYLKFDPVTDEDRTAMNIPNRDTTATPIGKPVTRAQIVSIKASGGFRIELILQDESAPGSHAVPYGMNGALLNYTVGAEKIADYDALKETRLMTRAHFTLELGPADEGKFLSCAARWQNERGELGPWDEIHHIAVG